MMLIRSSGDIHHVGIAVSNLSKSAAFYAQLLDALGYRIAHQSAEKISFHHRHSQFAFILSQASSASDQYDSRNGPGLHHLAFCACCKDEVDRVFRDVLSRSKHIRILDRHVNVQNTVPATMRSSLRIPMESSWRLLLPQTTFSRGAMISPLIWAPISNEACCRGGAG